MVAPAAQSRSTLHAPLLNTNHLSWCGPTPPVVVAVNVMAVPAGCGVSVPGLPG